MLLINLQGVISKHWYSWQLHRHRHLHGRQTSQTQIKTHGSELRGQEEAAVRDERVSNLHVALL